MSKFKAVLGFIVVAGLAIMIFLQYRTQQQLQNDNDLLRQQIAQLKTDNTEVPATNSNPSSDEFNELLRLRGEVSALRSQTNQIAKLEQQNKQLQDSLVATIHSREQSATQSEDERAHSIRELNTSKQAVLAMIMYANDNQDQFPTNFDQAKVYFGNSGGPTNLNDFEITYRGPLSNVANPSSAILVQSTQPWMVNGKWTKVYGFVDGHSEAHGDANGNFDEWEQQHAVILRKSGIDQ